jgi:hypothetical protein
MKSPGKKIKHKLKVSDEPGILFLGLVTPEPDYKTSLLLNSVLGTRFQSKSPFVKPAGEEDSCTFSRFSSGARFNDTAYELVANRNKNCIIDKKFTGIDYLLIIKGSEVNDQRNELISRIRSVGEITAVFPLDDDIAFADNIIQQLF